MRVEILPSTRQDKKFMAVFYEDSNKRRSVHFGAKGMRDFVLMNDKQSKFYEPDSTIREDTKRRYISRHRGDNLSDPLSAGALSRFILWNKPTLKDSIADFKRRFRLVG